MRRFILLILSLLPALGTHALTPEFAEIVQRGELIVALYEQDIVPFFGVNSKGELEGYDIDLAKKLASLLGVKVRFDRSYPTFDSVIEGVEQNRADLAISYISRTIKRAESVYFSEPYFKVHFGMAINRESLAKEIDKHQPFLSQIRDKKLKIAVLANSSMVDVGKKLFNADQIVYFNKNDEGFTAVKNKEVFAYLTDEIFMDQYILAHPNDSIFIKILLFKEMFDQLAITIPPGKRHLQYWINVVLDEQQKITVADLFDKYRRLVVERKRS